MWKYTTKVSPPPYHEVQTWSVDQAGITPDKNIWLKHSVDGTKLVAMDQSMLLNWRGDLTISQVSQISVVLKEMKDSRLAVSKPLGRGAPKHDPPARGPADKFPAKAPLPPNKPAFKPNLPVKPKLSVVPVPAPAPMEGDAYEVPNAIMSAGTGNLSKPFEFTAPPLGPPPSLALMEVDDFTDDGSFTEDDEPESLYEGEPLPQSGEGECTYEVLDSNYKVPSAYPTRHPQEPLALPSQKSLPALPVDNNKVSRVKLLPNFLSNIKKKNDKTAANDASNHRSPQPCFADRSSSGSSSGDGASAVSEAESQPWFFSVERSEAERLLAKAKNGTFLVRPSVRAGPGKPYTLSIHYRGQVFHISIRKRPDGLLAPGFEKPNEMAFLTLTALVDNYTKCSLDLFRNSELAGTTRLIQWPQ